MAGTTLADIIVPELFNPYVIKRTAELSALFQSGIVANDAEFDRLASQAAPTVNIPFFQDLTGDSEPVIESVALTAAGIASAMDIAALFRRAKMWSATDLSAAMAGSDPMQAIGDLVAGFWARDYQKELIAILNGVFASPSMATNLFDISSASGAAANFSASTFMDAVQLLGDNQDILSGIAMHSAVKTSLKKQNLIEVVRPSDGGEFEAYQGKRVIIDDGCPVAAGVYTTYIFGAGAVGQGNGSPVGFVSTEVDRDKKMGSGVDYLINRRTSILHPRGVAFTGKSVANAEGPSRAEFSTAANWNRVYEAKQIRLVMFKHKIA